jgi:competence protein ComEC
MLAALRPQLALVSAGWRSRFGHPHPDVLARLHDAGALVMNTATDGAIQVDMSRAPTPVAWRAERPAYWRER